MRADTVAGIVFVLLAILVYSANWQPSFEPTLGDPGSMLLPTVIGIAMGFGGLVLVVQSLARKRGGSASQAEQGAREVASPRDPSILWTGALTILALVSYVVLLHFMGYIISTTVFFVAAAVLLGERSWKSAGKYLVVALVIALATFYLLSLGLKISLPEGSLINLIEQPHA